MSHLRQPESGYIVRDSRATAVEFNVLECLRNAGSIVTRKTLAEGVGKAVGPVRPQCRRTRAQLAEKFPAMPHERIKTIRVTGYIYTPPE